MAFVFLVAIACRWFGWVEVDLDVKVELKILDIMHWYIGIYAGVRSAEKVATVVKSYLEKTT